MHAAPGTLFVVRCGDSHPLLLLLLLIAQVLCGQQGARL
jgi:hypothetical protein